jgi:hypothetical protein
MPSRREGPTKLKQTGYYFFDEYIGFSLLGMGGTNCPIFLTASSRTSMLANGRRWTVPLVLAGDPREGTIGLEQSPAAITFENSQGERFDLVKELEKLDVGRQETVFHPWRMTCQPPITPPVCFRLIVPPSPPMPMFLRASAIKLVSIPIPPGHPQLAVLLS